MNNIKAASPFAKKNGYEDISRTGFNVSHVQQVKMLYIFLEKKPIGNRSIVRCTELNSD